MDADKFLCTLFHIHSPPLRNKRAVVLAQKEKTLQVSYSTQRVSSLLNSIVVVRSGFEIGSRDQA
jgi:hypothetical protein